MDMTFADFCKVYEAEVRPRVREHTWLTKENIIQSKLLPFFGDMRMCDIRPVDIVRWQNSLAGSTRADGDGFKPTYLRIINNQLNAIFNHAERYYGLTDNPVRRVDKIGSKKGGEMQFWTKDEYLRFSEAVMDKPLSFHAFELLYWTGIRCGELLALTPSDFMLDSSRLRINKSYQSLLIEMGFSALAIAERMGHEAVDITYRYAHLFPTKQDEMAAALDGARG